MMLVWSLAAVVLLPLSIGIEVPGTTLGHVEFQHRAILDQMGKFVMLWTPLEKTIHIEIQVATPGYIGLGFSPSGGMTGADIVLAWVDDFTGELHVHDRFSQGPMIPMIDDVQDITVAGGYQNESHTVLRFSRPWDTCDGDQDLKLSKDTTRVIWSYSYEDPSGDMDMRKHDQRGSKSIYLQEPRFSMPSFPPDVKTMDFLMPEVRLPDDLDTLYWQKIFKIPDLPSKHHLIGFVPVIQEDNFAHVHHMLLHECHLDNSSLHFEKWLSVSGRQSYSANMPPSWRYCEHVIVGWAIGSEGEMYPEEVGLPIGEAYGGADYYTLEIHYDNPNIKKGIVDSSGVRLFYTDNLRDIEGGVLFVGHGTGPTMVIPPHQGWMSTGFCSGECTSKVLPEDGIKVFQGVLHSHLLGRAITVRHIRNGIELPTVFNDMNYDFNYQQQRVLKEPMVVLPGDTLIVECIYDSMRKSKTTFGGEGTNEEMCMVFLTYYPRIELSYCYSQPLLPNVYKSIGVKEIYEEEKHLNMIPVNKITTSPDIEELLARDLESLRNPGGTEEMLKSAVLKKVLSKSPKDYQNRTLYDLLNDENTWNNPKTLAKLQDQLAYGLHVPTCPMSSKDHYINAQMPETVKYPDFVSFRPIEEDQCMPVHQNEVYVSYERVNSPKAPELKTSKTPEFKDKSVAASGSRAVLYMWCLLVCLSVLYHTQGQ